MVNPRRIRPQALEIVEPAHRLVEHVHDHVAVIDEHPAAGFEALDTDGANARGAELFHDRIGDRRDMTATGAVADQERVTKGGELGEVELEEIDGFLGECGRDDSADELFRFDEDTLQELMTR